MAAPTRDVATSQCLEEMMKARIVCRVARQADRSNWRMTQEGLRLMRVTCRLQPRRPVFVCKRCPMESLENFTPFELWDWMTTTGWTFKIITDRQARAVAGFEAGKEKVVHCKTSAQALPRWSMIVHLRCELGTLDGPLAVLETAEHCKHLVHPELAETLVKEQCSRCSC